MTIELAFLLVSFFVSVASVMFFAKKNRQRKILGKDINKKSGKELPEGVGIALVAPLWASIIIFNIAFGFSVDTIAAGLTATGLSLVGFEDDKRHKFKTKTISWKTRAAIIALICFLFAAMYAPSPIWILPFLFFVAGLASFENTFAGLNGLEIGSGFIISCFAAFLLLGTWLFPLAIALVGAIAGLLLFNRYPARVFPGDSGTLLIGSMAACLIVLSQNMALFFLAALFFVPHAFDFFVLKLLTNPRDTSQSRQLPYVLRKDGKLEVPRYPKSGLQLDFAKMLLLLFGPMKEWQVVAIEWAVVCANCAFWVVVFQHLQLI
ncbi:MAG: hypothetical protein NTW59_01545 [Candidatus Diapherotrites archaeon]|nr:hypothetical protein [Candidatus Diapherotrites archaeon]